MTDRATAKLRDRVERPEWRGLWGQRYRVTPRLITSRFGDGRMLMIVSPISTRPDYFVVRVDSATRDPRDPLPGHTRPLIDDIMDAADDEFGSHDPDVHDGSSFPESVDWGLGCTWGEPFREWIAAPRDPCTITNRQRTRRRWARQGRR